MGQGYRCVCFPLQRQDCEPEEFLSCLEKLGLSPIWSRAFKVEYDPLLGGLDQTGEYMEAIDCCDAVERLQNENIEVVFHNEEEAVILRVGAASAPEEGRFAMHWTSGRSEKKTLQEWLRKCEINMHDLSAAFAQAVGTKSFSFEPVGNAIHSITGEIDREYFEEGRGDLKSYPVFFAGLPNESTDFFTDFVERKLTVSQRYVVVATSIGDVYCLALGKAHNAGSNVTLSDGMGTVNFLAGD